MRGLKYVGAAIAVALVVGSAVAFGVGEKEREDTLRASPGGLAYFDPHYATSADATGGLTVWSIGTEERFGVGSMIISADTNMNVSFYSETYLLNTVYFNVNGGACPVFNPGWRGLHKHDDLKIKTSAAGNISILVTGEILYY